jgi:hypothetical protein
MSSDLSGPLPEPGQNNLWFHYNDSDFVIVFLHGIFADSRSCWLHEDDSSPARSVYWPALVRSDQRFGDPSIYLAGYYTGPDAGPYEIRNCADEVLGGLDRQDAEGRPGPMTKPTMVFVCHSTGGIVARYLLEESEARFVAKKLGLVLIAAPSYGSKWANRLKWLARLYKQRLGTQIQWGNWNLRDLDARFKNLLNQKRLPNLRGVEAYENHFVFHRRWLPNCSLVHGVIDPLIIEVIERDPRELGYRSTVWTAPLLRQYLQEIHHLDVSRPSVSLAIDRLGLRWKRPRHGLARRPATWRQAKGGSNVTW